MSRRFLMLTTREQTVLAQSERNALLSYTGLDEEELTWVKLESEPFPNINFSSWDGLILCGSRYDASALAEEKSLRQKEIEQNLFRLFPEIIRRDFPFLGLCYGLGMLTSHLGGTVDNQYPEDISAPLLSVTAQGKRDPLLINLPDQFRAYVGHHEAVSKIPEMMTTLISGSACPTQMARVKRNIYATQFHPELDFEGINLRIEIFADSGYYPPEDRQDVEKRVAGIDTSYAHQILQNFVELFGGEAGAA